MTTEPDSPGEELDQEQIHFRGRLLTVKGMPGGWEMVSKNPASCVLAMQDGLVLGVEQYRPVVGITTWELPAGIIDPGETAMDAALRELAEETQLTGELTYLTEFYSSPGFTDEHTTLFLAHDLRPAAGTPDDTEDLRVSWRSLEQLDAAIRNGQLLTSASTAVGLAHAMRLG